MQKKGFSASSACPGWPSAAKLAASLYAACSIVDQSYARHLCNGWSFLSTWVMLYAKAPQLAASLYKLYHLGVLRCMQEVQVSPAYR